MSGIEPPEPGSLDEREWVRRIGELGEGGRLRVQQMRELAPRDLELVLASAALYFPASRMLSEREANERLAHFLSGPGRMLECDLGELRQLLVHQGYVVQYDYGAALRRGVLP
jgi:hypothetical protein